jgi:hypothetical protein
MLTIERDRGLKPVVCVGTLQFLFLHVVLLKRDSLCGKNAERHDLASCQTFECIPQRRPQAEHAASPDRDHAAHTHCHNIVDDSRMNPSKMPGNDRQGGKSDGGL